MAAAAAANRSGKPPVAPVNWAVVDEELARLPEDFKDPKFYALKHVVDILSSNDPKELVDEVGGCVGVWVGGGPLFGS
jgi:hypothetical protein